MNSKWSNICGDKKHAMDGSQAHQIQKKTCEKCDTMECNNQPQQQRPQKRTILETIVDTEIESPAASNQ